MRLHYSILPPLLLALDAPLAEANKNGDIDAADLVGMYFNHNECYNTEESFNTTILLEQDNELVPNGAIFLDYHDCGSVERTATIPIGTKLVLLPIAGSRWFDIDDDFNSDLVEECPGRETALFELLVEEESSFFKNLSSYTKKPFASVNGEPLETFWVFSDKEFYYKACPIDPDKQVCDECDVNFQPPEGCDDFAGMDNYPNYAWIAVDDTEWTSGETRTYNFGFSAVFEEEFEYCAEATYTLSTLPDALPANTTVAPSNSPPRGTFMFGLLLLLLISLGMVF